MISPGIAVRKDVLQEIHVPVPYIFEKSNIRKPGKVLGDIKKIAEHW